MNKNNTESYNINKGGNMEHLTNCHGEWNMLFAAIGSVPIIGVWIKFKLQTWENGNEKNTNN